MKIEQIEAFLNDFSENIIKEFETTQKDFKSLTIQKGLKFLEKNKLDVKRAKTNQFWLDYQGNIEKYRSWFTDELKAQNRTLKAKDKTEAFFKYVEKQSL